MNCEDDYYSFELFDEETFFDTAAVVESFVEIDIAVDVVAEDWPNLGVESEFADEQDYYYCLPAEK